MLPYEMVFIVRPTIEEDALNALVEKVSQSVRDLGGEIQQVDAWGRRRLAYPIQRHHDGFYFLMTMSLPSTAVRSLERGLKLMEDVIRYLVVRKDETPKSPEPEK